jgi:type IV pilus assembly protein PilO
MTYAEQFDPNAEEQQGGGLFGIKLTPQIQGVLIAIAGIGGGVALFIYVLQPALQKQEELKESIRQKNIEIAQLEQIVAKKGDAEANLAKQRQLKAEVGALFGEPQTLDTLLLDINKIVKDSGATLIKFSPITSDPISQALFPGQAQAPAAGAAAAPQGDFRGVPITLELEGTFSQTQSIIRNIERLEPLINLGKYSSQIDQETLQLEVDEQGRPKRLTEPKLQTSLDLLVIVPAEKAPPPAQPPATQPPAAPAK